MTSRKKRYVLSYSRRVFDIFVRLALAVFFAFAAANYFRNGFLALGDIDFMHLQPQQVGQAISVLLVGLNTFMIASLYVLRLPPITHFPGVLPCVAAILGGFLMAALLFITPQDHLPLWAQFFAFFLVISGNALALVVISFLGRSFSILPEGRRLITYGPYAIVRHPLYLAEAIATVGMVISFLSPLALVLMVAQFALQLVRMHYEEKILKETFVDYTAYAKKTMRLIPGIY